MSNVAKLKKKAAELEQKKQFDKALAVYVELLDQFDAHAEELDVALFNRVGDLLMRQGNVADAVDYYEKAVDHYAEGGFYNNAIALCNKILRHSPGRVSVYYKVGKISAQKGFKSDAKQNFLEYADRMQKSGNIDEAFRALKEFADLCPDQDDIRLMLADQLSKLGRKDEAIEQLQLLHERYVSEGRGSEAEATVARMKTIDPAAEPRGGDGVGSVRGRQDAGLVFLDLEEAPRRPSQEMPAIVDKVPEPVDLDVVEPEPPRAPTPARPSRPVTPALDGLEITSFGGDAATEAEPETVLDLERSLEGDHEPAPRLSSHDIDFVDLNAPAEAEMLELDEPTSEPDLPLLETSNDLDFVVEADIGANDGAATDIPLIMPDETESEDLATVEDDDYIETPAHAMPRASTIIAAQSVDILRASVEGEPDDWSLRRELGEAMLESGDREGAIAELETAMTGADRAGDLDLASAIAEELGRIDSGSIRHHQKRVEYAFRLNDKPHLIEAYIALAGALTDAEQTEKARAVYQRVLDIAPDDIRAQAALETLPAEPAPPPPPPRHTAPFARQSIAMPAAPVDASPSAAPLDSGPADFVNLGDWLRDDDGPKDTRMVVAEEEPTGDEDADFADMLRKFKQGVAQNVEAEDYQSHYDLGVAYKEMGLVDEAIAEFQKALRGPENRVRTYEALGQCFIEKEQYSMAHTVLSRALSEPGAHDDTLIGVLYLLGRAAEGMSRHEEALAYYQRVFVVDIEFRDVADRIHEVERAGR